MSETIELQLAKEQATDITVTTYWWKAIKDMEYLGALYVNGFYRRYYKTKGGRYYFKIVIPEDYMR